MIAEACVEVATAVAEVERVNHERYAWRRMLDATDEALWELEECNRRGVPTLSEGAGAELRASLSELPAEALAVLGDGLGVQALMESVYDAQEVLFRLRDPGYAGEAEQVPADPALVAGIRKRVIAHPCRIVFDIVSAFPGFLDPSVRATVRAMREAGELAEAEVDGRRQFVVGEGSGG